MSAGPDAESEFVRQAVNWVWEKRHAIVRRLAELRDWFKAGSTVDHTTQPGILVIGPGGVGKSTFAKIVCGDYDPLLDDLAKYDESLVLETYRLSDPHVEIVVPPGQQHRRETSWTQLERDLAAGRFRGIILLGSHGYHTLGQVSYKTHKLFKGDDEAFLNAYLKDRRNEEIAILERLSTHIAASSNPIWLLTLITKQDLWWLERAVVEQFYHAGKYARIIGEIENKKGSSNFRHEVLPVSLVISRFLTGKREHLADNVAGYDQSLQVSSLRILFETLDSLRQWEMQT